MSRGGPKDDPTKGKVGGKERPKDQSTRSYEVGKGRPPLETRFTSERQPANRGGRRKEQKNYAQELREIFAFKLTDPLLGEKVKKLSPFGAMAWKQFLKAMSADTRAFDAITDLARDFGILVPEPPEVPHAELTTAEQATVDDYFASFAAGKGIDLGLLISSSEKAALEASMPMPVITVTPSPRGPTVRAVDFSQAIGPTPPRRAKTARG